MQQQQVQLRSLNIAGLQKSSQATNSKVQQRFSSTQISTTQAQSNATSLNTKTDQILNQLQTLACSTQAQTENTEKLQIRLQKSEETLEGQKKLNQALRMENGKIVEQLRLSTCSMEQLELQVHSMVSNVQEQKSLTSEIQEKLKVAETKYEESKKWRNDLELRLARTGQEVDAIKEESNKQIEQLKSALQSKDAEIESKSAAIHQAGHREELLLANIENIKTAMTRKESECRELKDLTSQREKKCRELESQLQNSKNETMEQKHQSEVFCIENAKLEFELENLKVQLAGQKKSFEAQAKERDASCQNLMEEMKNNVQDSERRWLAERDQLLSSIQRAEAQAKSVQEELSNVSNVSSVQLEERDQEISTLKSQIALLQTEFEGLSSANTCLTKERDHVVNSIQSIESFHDQKDSAFSSQIDNLESTIFNLERVVSFLQTQVVDRGTKLEDQVVSLRDAKNAAEQQLKENQKIMESSHSKLLAFEKELKCAEQRADEKIKHNLFEAQKHLNSQIVSLKDEHTACIQHMQAERQMLKEQLAKSEQHIAHLRNLEHDAALLREQNDKLRKELVEEGSKLEQMSSMFQDKNSKIVELEKQIENLKLVRDLLPSSRNAQTNAVTGSMEFNKITSSSVTMSITEEASAKMNMKPSQSGAKDPTSTQSSVVELDTDDQEIESGFVIRKRALGPYSKGKHSNKKAPKKQAPIPSREDAPTVKKNSSRYQTRGRDQDEVRSWDDNYAEFDLFSSSVDL